MKTFRVSNIPTGLAEDDTCSILGDTAFVESLAPAANATDAGRKQVALVTFDTIPERLSAKGLTRIPVPRKLLAEAGLKRRWDLEVDTEFLGLTPLNAPSAEEDIVMDVVAIAGLGEHAFESWKAKNGDFMWLRDALPADVAGLRILTYGYNSSLTGSTSFASISTFAKELCQHMIGARNHPDSIKRPLVFIAHGLGGLVVKQALVEAARGGELGQTVFKSTIGLLLFGVPNRGLVIESLMPMVHGQPNEALVRSLEPESAYLDILHHDFCTHFTFKDSKIVSFWETALSSTAQKQPDGGWAMTGPRVVLVPKSSATGSRPNEPLYHEYPINRSNSEMVKYTSGNDVYYLIVRGKLEELRKDASATIAKRFDPSLTIDIPTTEADNLLRTKHGWSHLHLASNKGNAEKVQRLLEQGAYIEETAMNGTTALHHAASGGYEAVVKILLDRKANIEAVGFDKATPLHSASRSGRATVVQLLLDSGADIEAKTHLGMTALYVASAAGQEAVAGILLLQGADIEAKAQDQSTPLHAAIRLGRKAVANILLDHGANIEAESERLQMSFTKTITGLPVNSYQRVYITPLQGAAFAGNADIVKLLLDRGANIEAKSDSSTPLHIAAFFGHDAVIKVLLDYKADIEAEDKFKQTPLLLASAMGKEAEVKTLLDRGANIEAKVKRTLWTPLLAASSCGHFAVVRTLIERKANTKATDWMWRGPMHLAKTAGHREIVKFLGDHGAQSSWWIVW